MDSALCDNIEDCVDGSDELRCYRPLSLKRPSRDLPILANFGRNGNIVTTSLDAGRGTVGVVCPETHFWCPHKDYCLPVFVRCNGVYDCPGHEDEEGCNLYTCPGFYRCRASKMCVHVIHVCDDLPQCPQLDDELLCSQSCPLQCMCHGLSFFCDQAFSASHYPGLRYLDVRGSGMNAHELGDNQMLVHLSLARCAVRNADNVTLQNLHSLDLSDNLLTEVSVHHFGRVPQLTVLFLGGNPLIHVFMSNTTSSSDLGKINMLDLSRVKMHSVNTRLFLVFPELHTVNLSFCGIQQWNSQPVSAASVRKLDLRGCSVDGFHQDILKGFPQLQLLFTDNFKLCCPSVLPIGFDLNHCHVTPDEVSSCDDLLGVTAHRITVAVLTTLALLGNTISIALRGFVRSSRPLSSGGVVLTHLSVADLGTGLYLATLGLADRLLAGHYVWQDRAWRTGVVCQLAGLLALSCRHVATLFITILILDRCLRQILTLTVCFTPVKVKVMCMVAWASSLVVASVPLSPQWRFYGQQALCVPLPHKRSDSVQSYYAYGVMVITHLIMLIFCSLCEGVSWVSVRGKSNITMDKHTRPSNAKFVVMGSLTCGFLFTIACLVPTDSHSDSQKATHTALVYFGSVVSCAMNPYLHLYGVHVERRKQMKVERLRMIINRTQI